MMGFGAGIGGNRLPVLRQNLTAEAQYRNLSATRDFGSTKDRDRLAGKTQRALNKAVLPNTELALVFIGEHADDVMNAVVTGDVVRVTGNDDYEVYDDLLRVEQKRGQTDNDGNETIFLDVTEDYD
jgi:hypothetical protein